MESTTEVECSNIKNFFEKFFLRELGNEMRKKVLHHLSECVPCKDEWIKFYSSKVKFD